MKYLILLPFLISCLPEKPKDAPNRDPVIFDPLAPQAWHLDNTGQNSYSEGYAIAGEDHKIKAVHELKYTGKGIRIAVSDTGVQVNHPDLEQNQLKNEHRDYRLDFPFLGNPEPIVSKKNAPHGTAVTGLISAIQGNNVGAYGVAPDSLFAGFNFLDSSFEFSIYLHQMTGNFDIFNYSYGDNGSVITSPYSDLVLEALKQGSDKGSIYVKAAGNSYIEFVEGYIFGNANFEADQTIPYFIVVGAVNARGVRSSYSTPGANLWISGAGGEFGVEDPAMITTDLTGCSYGFANKETGASAFDKGFEEINPHCDFTNSMNGTSSAAPVISGIIALLKEANPKLTWRDIKHILAKTADRVDYSVNNTLEHPLAAQRLTGHTYDVKWTKNMAGNFFSNWYGFGRANALEAVLMASSYDFPLGEYQEENYPSASNLNKIIPAGAGGVEDEIEVMSSEIAKIESIQLEVILNHPKIGELGIELTSPQGTTSRLFLINSGAIDSLKGTTNRKVQLLSNAFYEENPQGKWTLKIIDGNDADPDQYLEAWSLKVNGH